MDSKVGIVARDAPDQAPNEVQVDRSSFSVARLTDPDDSPGYWLSRPVDERLRALELLRMTFYGHSYAAAGLQRILEVARLARS
jgi:hypothetical protein